jgi:hypothetical protein
MREARLANLRQLNLSEQAIDILKCGPKLALKQGDHHAQEEIQEALEELQSRPPVLHSNQADSLHLSRLLAIF